MPGSYEGVEAKLRRTYPGVLVNKGYSSRQELRRLPRFISEWVIDRFSRDGMTEDSVAKMDEFVRKHYPEPRERQKILSEIMEQGSFLLIDSYRVETDLKRNRYVCIVPSLEIKDALISPELVDEHPQLLIDGVWSVGTVEYLPDEGTVFVSRLAPLGVSKVDFDAFAEGRAEFSTEEWIEVLLNTFGVNPDVYRSQREDPWRMKLILLSRAIPLVEPNCNFVELGPKGTGKTSFHRDVSYHSRIVSGGTVTPATLFYNLTTRRDGLLPRYDDLVFDEIATLRFQGGSEIIGKLKDFMESGQFDRGPKQSRSECSLVFLGNLELLGDHPKNEFIFANLGDELRDSAFIDRIHACLPGWELPKIQLTEIHLSRSLGFAADYFCEILHEMRRLNFQARVQDRLGVSGTKVNIRDQRSVLKIVSGLMKLLFPNGRIEREWLTKAATLAQEYRGLVISQLRQVDPGEFQEKELKVVVN